VWAPGPVWTGAKKCKFDENPTRITGTEHEDSNRSLVLTRVTCVM